MTPSVRMPVPPTEPGLFQQLPVVALMPRDEPVYNPARLPGENLHSAPYTNNPVVDRTLIFGNYFLCFLSTFSMPIETFILSLCSGFYQNLYSFILQWSMNQFLESRPECSVRILAFNNLLLYRWFRIDLLSPPCPWSTWLQLTWVMSLPGLFPRLPTIGLVKSLSGLLGHQLLRPSWCLSWLQAVLLLLLWRQVVHLLLLLLLTLPPPFGKFFVSYLYSFLEDGFNRY
jgi:hypothetical protein